MNRYKAKGVLAFLWVLAAFTIVAPLALANEVQAEWTIDIARQLLADGWEDVQREGTTPVVGYAIHFVELESDLVRRMEFGFDLDTGEQGPGLWQITAHDSKIELLVDTPFRFAPNLHAEWGHANQVGNYDSWLVTTIGRPLRVDISTTRVPAVSKENKEERLEIAILPKHVDWLTGQIESEITLAHETLNKNLARLQTTAMIGAITDRPIAVVSREVAVGRKTEYQYFAVYIVGTVIPEEMIPTDVPVISMGTIMGLQEVMEDVPERRLAELGLGAIYDRDQWGVLVASSLPIGDHLRVYGRLETLPDFVYVVGIEGGLNRDLYLVAEMGGLSGDEFAVHLGVRDELLLGEHLKLSAALLPIRFSLAGTGERLVLHWRVQAELYLEKTSLWYRAHNDVGRVTHQVGVSAFRHKPAEAFVSWSWNEQSGSVFTAGVCLKF